jgi:hypothetical protein
MVLDWGSNLCRKAWSTEMVAKQFCTVVLSTNDRIQHNNDKGFSHGLVVAFHGALYFLFLQNPICAGLFHGVCRG